MVAAPCHQVLWGTSRPEHPETNPLCRPMPGYRGRCCRFWYLRLIGRWHSSPITLAAHRSDHHHCRLLVARSAGHTTDAGCVETSEPDSIPHFFGSFVVSRRHSCRWCHSAIPTWPSQRGLASSWLLGGRRKIGLGIPSSEVFGKIGKPIDYEQPLRRWSGR